MTAKQEGRADRANRHQKSAAGSRGGVRTVDYSLITPIAQRVALLSVHVLWFKAAFLDDKDSQVLAERSASDEIRYKAQRLGYPTSEDERKSTLISLIDFKFRGGSQEGPAVQIEGGVIVTFRWSGPIGAEATDEALDLFAEVNGGYSAWPYIRELVSNCAMRLGNGRIQMPVWRNPSVLQAKGKYEVLSRELVAAPSDSEDPTSS